jgi:hypothetical protein
MRPQVLGQPLVGGVRLGREDQLGQLVLQAAAGHRQAVPADLPRLVAVPQVQAGPQQFSHPAREELPGQQRPARSPPPELIPTEPRQAHAGHAQLSQPSSASRPAFWRAEASHVPGTDAKMPREMRHHPLVHR